MQRHRLRQLSFLASLVACTAATDGRAADDFVYTTRRELHAVDAKTGNEVPFSNERIGGQKRRALGVTGRVAIFRGPVWVDDGGQLFIHATLPEALASKPRDLDVYVDGPDGLRPRGSIPFAPGGSRRVSRLFVVPDLERGPALAEVHVRGAHAADWQEIVTGPTSVPKKARLRFGYALDGVTAGKTTSLEVVVEARYVDEAGRADEDEEPRLLLEKRVTASADGVWVDERIDLGKLAGKNVRFAFRSRPQAETASEAPGLVWGTPAIEVDEKRRAYPLILVVSFDSLRAGAVGLYGGASGQTPFLDSFFGREGAVFLHASTQAVTTLPSHMTMMTGLDPLSHGVIDESHTLTAGARTLAEALRREGWYTVAFTEGGALAGELGFGRGFDLYEEGESQTIAPDGADALERAARWLDDYSGKPLFLFVHTYATRPVHGGVDGTDSRVRDAQIAAYLDQVRRGDRALAQLVDTTEGRIDSDESVFVVTSGHGEEFFEHGAAGHGTQLYEEATRIPLLVRGERVRESGRHDVGIGLVDLAPTLLELARADVPATMQGQSFARFLEKGKDVLEGPRFSEARRPVRLTADGRLVLWGPPSYAVRSGPHKVIWHAGSSEAFEAYDLSRDPGERRDLIAAGPAPEWAKKLAASLRAYPSVAERRAAGHGPRAELSTANRERLESLGYAR